MTTINNLIQNGLKWEDLGQISFFGSKTYLSYSANGGGYSMRTLNIIQRILRSVFGSYQDTHLNGVLLNLIYRTKDEFSVSFFQAARRKIFGRPDSLIQLRDITLKMQACWNKHHPQTPVLFNPALTSPREWYNIDVTLSK